MDFEYLYEEYLQYLLEALLNERLQFNNRFLNVEVTHDTKELTINWYGTKDRPDGEIDFSKRTIPFNFTHIYEEIGKQYAKLRRKV